MHRTQVNLPEDLYPRAKALAERTGRSLSDLVRESLERYLSSAPAASA